MLKDLLNKKKHLSLARKSFKNQEEVSENGRPEMFSENGKCSANTGGWESGEFILRTILVITFHKLFQQHSERLYLRSIHVAKEKVIAIQY